MYIVLWSDGVRIERNDRAAIVQYIKEVHRAGMESPNLRYKVYKEVRCNILEKEIIVELDGVAYE